MNSLGAAIRSWRLRKGITQKALAAELKRTTRSVMGWEGGSRVPSVTSLRRLEEMGFHVLDSGSWTARQLFRGQA